MSRTDSPTVRAKTGNSHITCLSQTPSPRGQKQVTVTSHVSHRPSHREGKNRWQSHPVSRTDSPTVRARTGNSHIPCLAQTAPQRWQKQVTFNITCRHLIYVNNQLGRIEWTGESVILYKDFCQESKDLCHGLLSLSWFDLISRDGKRSRRNTFRSNSTCGVSNSDHTGQRSSEPSKESILLSKVSAKVGESSINMGDKKSSLESKSVSWSNCDNKPNSSPMKLSHKSSQESDSEPEAEDRRRRRNGTEEFQSKRDNTLVSKECLSQSTGSSEGIHKSASALDILSADNVAIENLEGEIKFHLETSTATEGQIFMLNQNGDVDYKLTDLHNPEIKISQSPPDKPEKKDLKLIKNSSSSDFRPDTSETEDTTSTGPRLDLPSSSYNKDLKKESESDSEMAESDQEIRSFQGLRRRKTRADDSSESGASYCRPRRQPKENKTNRRERELTPNLEQEDIHKVKNTLQNK